MKNEERWSQPRWRALWPVAGFAMLYIALTFLLPPNRAVLTRYNISPAEAKLLSFSIVLPMIGIWYAAFYGYHRFARYAHSLQGSKDGKAFRQIALGLKILALGLPLGSLVNVWLSYAARQAPSSLEFASILNSYVPLVFAFAAFWSIQKGARNLIGLVKKIPNFSNITIVSFLTLAVVYCYLTFTHLQDSPTADGLSSAVFYLPDWAVIVGVVIPYLYIWYRGFISAYAILYYSKNISGIWYRQAIKHLAAGLTVVLLSSVMIQYLTALSIQLTQLPLRGLLGVIYLLLIIIAAGYLLIARGAKRLERLEEV